MTATPRLYHDSAKKTAAEKDMVLCSMDDKALYGETFYHIGFGEAVNRGLLSDYKVLILTVSEKDMPSAVQRMVADGKTEIPAADINKLIGCVNALSKEIIGDNGVTRAADPALMSTAVAFCPKIKWSKQIAEIFNQMGDLYYKQLPDEAKKKMVSVTCDHVDGTMSAPTREQKLAWLRSSDRDAFQCNILSNVRCLSEGVDVPSLDAVIFLSARNSQVDVVRSVGRVMRRAPGKKYGYIIIPVVTPSGVAGEKAMDNNAAYAVVWTVLNALRAHDDRFAATVNKIELNKNKPVSIIIGKPTHGEEPDDTKRVGKDKHELDKEQLTLQFNEMQGLLYAKLVEKVGDRRYWEQWAADVAIIAEREIASINALVNQPGRHRDAFANFLAGLRKNINPAITDADAVEMLGQHLITQPVFDALFENYSFIKNNPVSQSMEAMLALLAGTRREEDTATLKKFYDSVRDRADKLDNAEARQRVIIELYDKFFRTAFPLMVERLGIVYTPIEVVDYIIRSVDAVLRKEFDRTLGDENLHIFDPFTGTGTFITRLLESGLISPKDLSRKYRKEIHANEIVLLAYYIASVNIENVWHDLMDKSKTYTPFEGICLTDTFQLGEIDGTLEPVDKIFPFNSSRVDVQRKAPLMVIIGNPPYSVGQKSANDNAQNQSYPKLERRIEQTYAAAGTATLQKALYDSYIKAFRWSSDRLDPKNGGIICFVSNGAWLDTNGMDGFRHCLEKEFSSIYVFNLRGNQRTSDELSRKEGGKIFGSGSRTPISITLLVKKSEHYGKAIIHYCDIGDYLNRNDKLAKIKDLRDVSDSKMSWTTLSPNEHNDWLNQRNDTFNDLIPLAPEKKIHVKTNSIFTAYSLGNISARDSWVCNFSTKKLHQNIKTTIAHYAEQRQRFNAKTISEPQRDSLRENWTCDWINQFNKGHKIVEETNEYRMAIYRPFQMMPYYFADNLNQERYQLPRLFPTPNLSNLVICVSGLAHSKDFSAFVTDKIPCFDLVQKTQCFPLYWYEEIQEEKTLFDLESDYARRDGISDHILTLTRKLYGSKTSKEDVFYYVYALLHHPEYRKTFSTDLKKRSRVFRLSKIHPHSGSSSNPDVLLPIFT